MRRAREEMAERKSTIMERETRRAEVSGGGYLRSNGVETKLAVGTAPKK